jgi:hypothetical protein
MYPATGLEEINRGCDADTPAAPSAIACRQCLTITAQRLRGGAGGGGACGGIERGEPVIDPGARATGDSYYLRFGHQ